MKEKKFFEKVMSKASTYAHKANDLAKNFVDNKRFVLCEYCAVYQ